MASPPERRRAARHRQPTGDDTDATRRGPSSGRKKPITVDTIVETAFGIVEGEGYAALTMRRVASALETGPASLYAHVVNKADLDDLLIGRLCAEIELPQPNPNSWREQLISVCIQLREQYLRYPGISLATLAVAPTNLETLRVSEGMLGIVLAQGVDPQTAAWTVDALVLYVNAFCLEISLRHRSLDSTAPGDGVRHMMAELPDAFPNTKRYANELTTGTAAERFAFTLNLIMDGLTN